MTRMWKGEGGGTQDTFVFRTSVWGCVTHVALLQQPLACSVLWAVAPLPPARPGTPRLVSGSHFRLATRPGTRGGCRAGVTGRQRYLLAGDEQIAGRLSCRNAAAAAAALLPAPSARPWRPPRSSGTGVNCAGLDRWRSAFGALGWFADLSVGAALRCWVVCWSWVLSLFIIAAGMRVASLLWEWGN